MKRSLTIISLLLFICLGAMAGDKMPKYDITGNLDQEQKGLFW